MPEELWTEVHDIVQETGIKTISKKKKCKKAKWLSEEALQTAVKRREVKNKGGKERYMHLNGDFQRIARRDKKAFLSGQSKEIEENNRVGKTRDLFKKIRDTKGTWITACLNQGNYESCHVVSPKMDGLLWRILTKGGLQRREWQTMPAFLPEELHE